MTLQEEKAPYEATCMQISKLDGNTGICGGSKQVWTVKCMHGELERAMDDVTCGNSGTAKTEGYLLRRNVSGQRTFAQRDVVCSTEPWMRNYLSYVRTLFWVGVETAEHEIFRLCCYPRAGAVLFLSCL